MADSTGQRGYVVTIAQTKDTPGTGLGTNSVEGQLLGTRVWGRSLGRVGHGDPRGNLVKERLGSSVSAPRSNV